MKRLVLIVAFMVSSCASHQSEVIVSTPAFDKDKVCSSSALEYLKNSKIASGTTSKAIELSNQKMQLLRPMVKSCYDQLLKHQEIHFNLCYVTGFDKNGAQVFSNFSAAEVNVPKSFFDCLETNSKSVDFVGLKNVNIIQAFKLFAR